MEQAEEQLAEALETEAALQKKHRAATERLQGEQSQKETLEAEIADLRAEVRCAEQRGQRAAKVAGNRRLQLQRSRQERQDLQSRCARAHYQALMPPVPASDPPSPLTPPEPRAWATHWTPRTRSGLSAAASSTRCATNSRATGTRCGSWSRTCSG